MSKTVKKIKTVPPRLSSSFADEVVDCQNIRLVTNALGNAELRPVGHPSVIVNGNYRPLLRHVHDDSTVSLLLADGNVVGVASLGDEAAPAGQPVVITTLAETPETALSLDEATIAVFTRHDIVYLDFDGGQWTARGALEQFPPLTIRAVDAHTFSSSTPARTLSGGYSHWSGSLSSADTDTVTSDLLAAYSDACSAANAAGYFVQPVVARYRILDKWGNTLFRSAPVLVSACGLQGVAAIYGQVSLSGGTFSNLAPATVEVTGYKLAVAVGGSIAGRWKDVAAQAVVELSPQFEPIDTADKAITRMENATSTSGTLRMLLPGASDADAKMRHEIVAALPKLDNLMIVADVVNCPFDSSVVTALSPISLDVTPTKFLRNVDAIKAVSSDADAFVRLLSAPNSVGAKTAVAVGDDIVIGDITVRRHRADSPFSTAVTSASSSATWRAFSRVRLADGNVLVNSFAATALEPAAFSPLVVYPSSDAVEIEYVFKDSNSVVRRLTMPLTPAPEAGLAFYIADTLAPAAFPVDTSPYIVPAETVVPVSLGRSFAIAKARSPRCVTAAGELASGEILAITPAVRTSSAWDFARLHLYAFATSGIYALAVNAARKKMAVSLIDSRPVVSAAHVAPAVGAVYALAASDLVEVAASSAKTLATGVSARALGWDSSHNELWIARDNEVRIMSAAGFYTRTMSVSAMARLGGLLYVATGSAVTYAGEEVPAGEIDIAWSLRLLRDDVTVTTFPPRLFPPRLFSIAWNMNADFADIALRIDGDNGSGRSVNMLTLEADGAIDFPINARTNLPTRLFMSFSFEGTADASFSFRGISLLFDRYGQY